MAQIALAVSDFNSFWAGAGGPIFGAVITATGGWILWQLNRTKTSRIVCAILGTSSTVRIDPKVASAVSVTYKGEAVPSLSVLELAIYNDGDSTISNVELVIKLPDPTVILDFENDCPITTVEQLDRGELRLSRPYLNAYGRHREQVNLKIICRTSAETVTLVGGGAGWSTRTEKFIDLPSVPKREFIFGLFALCFGFTAIGSPATFKILETPSTTRYTALLAIFGGTLMVSTNLVSLLARRKKQMLRSRLK